MANFLVTNRVENIKDLADFNAHGYRISKGDSTPTSPVFTRSEKRRGQRKLKVQNLPEILFSLLFPFWTELTFFFISR